MNYIGRYECDKNLFMLNLNYEKRIEFKLTNCIKLCHLATILFISTSQSLVSNSIVPNSHKFTQCLSM